MTDDDRADGWVGSVLRSPLDNRVWFAVVPDTDIMASEGHCSVSVRRVKGYVTDLVASYPWVKAEDITWVRENPDTWTAYVKEDR